MLRIFTIRIAKLNTERRNRTERNGRQSRTAPGRERCGGHYPKMHHFRCHLFSQIYFRLGGQTISCWDRRHLEALPTEPPRPHRNYTNRLSTSTVNIIYLELQQSDNAPSITGPEDAQTGSSFVMHSWSIGYPWGRRCGGFRRLKSCCKSLTPWWCILWICFQVAVWKETVPLINVRLMRLELSKI